MDAPQTPHKSLRWLILALTLGLAASLMAVVTFAGALQDQDGDLVPDGFDNCLLVANGPGDACDQVDADQDGYGNGCDCDFNNNFVCDINDFSAVGAAFQSTMGSPNYDPNLDSNCNDSIDINDFAAVGAGFQGPPGPGLP